MIRFTTVPETPTKSEPVADKRAAAPVAPVSDLLEGDSKGAGDKPKPARARIASRAAAKPRSAG